jgi:hypothetical protein
VFEVKKWLNCGLRAAGVIIPRRIRSASLLADIPCFLIDGELSESSLDGRVAMIDLSRACLMIDPDFETLERYTRQNECTDPFFKIRKGRLYSADELSGATEGDMLENILSLIEENSPRGLCISLDLSRYAEERFEAQAEALFRAAVYGEISMMFSKFRSSEEIRRGTEKIYSVFCELEKQGREINGCVARGFLIDSPIWLFERRMFGKSDFICFDFDRLSAGLLGVPESSALSDGNAADTLCRFWENYHFSYYAHERAELRAVSRRFYNSKLFCDWVEFMNLGEIYLPPQKNT